MNKKAQKLFILKDMNGSQGVQALPVELINEIVQLVPAETQVQPLFVTKNILRVFGFGLSRTRNKFMASISM